MGILSPNLRNPVRILSKNLAIFPNFLEEIKPEGTIHHSQLANVTADVVCRPSKTCFNVTSPIVQPPFSSVLHNQQGPPTYEPFNSSKKHTYFHGVHMNTQREHCNTIQHMYTCASKECTGSCVLVSSLEVEHLCLELP